MKRLAFCAAAIATAFVPAAASAGDPWEAGLEQRRGAFAGATLRLLVGPRGAPAPEARLGIGLIRERRDRAGFVVERDSIGLPLAAGLAGGRPELFVGGERLSRLERRLAANGDTTTVLVVGGVALGAAALLLLLADGEDDDGPCPPGVEVCTQ